MAASSISATKVVVAGMQQAAGSRARRVGMAATQPAAAPSFAAQVLRKQPVRVSRQSIVASAARHQPVVLAAAAAPPNWQVLARAEIPSHIPRPDFLKQIYIWATQHCAESQKLYGVIMEVDTVDEKQADGEELTVAFTISFLKFVDDKKSTKVLKLVCEFDQEVVPVYDMVSQDDDTGMPVMTTRDGKERSTKGKYFLVKRDKSVPAPKEYVAPVNKLLQTTMEAVNKYYAFGSTFSEEF